MIIHLFFPRRRCIIVVGTRHIVPSNVSKNIGIESISEVVGGSGNRPSSSSFPTSSSSSLIRYGISSFFRCPPMYRVYPVHPVPHIFCSSRTYFLYPPRQTSFCALLILIFDHESPTFIYMIQLDMLKRVTHIVSHSSYHFEPLSHFCPTIHKTFPSPNFQVV